MAAERGLSERLASMEQRVLLVESMVAENKAAIADTAADLLAKLNTAQQSTMEIGDGLQQVTADMQKFAAGLNAQKIGLTEDLNSEFDAHKLALAQVVNAAREEFGNLQSNITSLHSKTAQTFAEVRDKVEQMEKQLDEKATDRNTGSNSHGFLPVKSMVPPVFGGSEDKWRSWQDDVSDYIDSQKAGLKVVMKAAEKSVDPISDLWMAEQTIQSGIGVEKHKANLYRALKQLTSGEARTVVQGVRGEDGFEAWRSLHQRFGPSVAARQGKVMHELSQMVTKPAKSPAETRSLVTELERRIRTAEEITGDVLGDAHGKSILAAILDPITRAHTSAYQGSATGYQDFKRVVLEFANNTADTGAKANSGAEPMQLGQCGESARPWVSVVTSGGEEAAAEEDWERVGDLAAVSAHTQCYNCGGFGHVALKCSSPKGGKGGKPGKGGGKGEPVKGASKGGKGGPKGGKAGGGKGPAGGCWTCGGPHYSSECPASAWPAKGGGKGKGLHCFNSADLYWPEPSVRPLCTLQTIPQTTTSNRYDALGEEDEEDGQHCAVGVKLGDYKLSPPRPSQRQQRAERKQTEAKKQQATATPMGRLSPLTTIEPAGLAPVAEAPEWEAIELAVDSGASETVIPEGMIKSVDIQPSEASKRGVQYEVANGHRIPNLGQKAFQGVTPEGHRRGITAQVCDVNKPLLSVTRLVSSGNTVVFSRSGSYVKDDATGETMQLHETGGMFMLRLWVPASGF